MCYFSNTRQSQRYERKKEKKTKVDVAAPPCPSLFTSAEIVNHLYIKELSMQSDKMSCLHYSALQLSSRRYHEFD